MVTRSDSPLAAGGEAFRGEGFLDQLIIARRGGGELAVSAVPPFLRALLVTDGTVTKILEAYFWEPVEVVTLSQELVPAGGPIPWIDVAEGDRVLQREARLRGARSGRVYASASSLIRTELIPEGFRQRLIDREIGIGVLIRDSGLESYREVLEIGAEPSAGPEVRGDGVFRTYRIIIAGAPVILITERFPLAPYL